MRSFLVTPELPLCLRKGRNRKLNAKERKKKTLNRIEAGTGEAMGQCLETFSFFHSMKSLMPASDLRLNQSHHYKVGGVWGYFLFVFGGMGGLHGEVDN